MITTINAELVLDATSHEEEDAVVIIARSCPQNNSRTKNKRRRNKKQQQHLFVAVSMFVFFSLFLSFILFLVSGMECLHSGLPKPINEVQISANGSFVEKYGTPEIELDTEALAELAKTRNIGGRLMLDIQLQQIPDSPKRLISIGADQIRKAVRDDLHRSMPQPSTRM
jgi:hypothetical protein